MGLLTSIFLNCCFDCFFLLSSAHFHKKYHVTSAEQKGSLETRMCVLYTLKSQRSTWITFGRGYYQEYSNLKNKTKQNNPNTHTPIKTKYGNYDIITWRTIMMYTDSMSIGSGGLRVSGVAPPTPFRFQNMKKNVKKQGKNRGNGKKKERNSFITYVARY